MAAPARTPSAVLVRTARGVAVEIQRYSCRRREPADAANVEALSHAAADHALEQPMHISDRGSQDVNLRGFDKTLGIIGLRQ